MTPWPLGLGAWALFFAGVAADRKTHIHPKEKHVALLRRDGTVARAGALESLGSARNKRSECTLVRSEASPPTDTKTQGLGERLKDGLVAVVLGWALVLFSIALLALNERRQARMEGLLYLAARRVRSLDDAKPDPEHRGSLVHLSGQTMRATVQVRDKQFEGVEMKEGCVRLRVTTEVFQWVEQQEKEAKEKLGGSKETKTTYTYHTRWDKWWHDSSSFRDRRKVNANPSGVAVGSTTTDCDRVEYGDGFVLPSGLITQCLDFQPVGDLIGAKVQVRGKTFTKTEDGLYYCPEPTGPPQVGDARACFEYVPNGPASVLALQDANRSGPGETFLPYRTIHRGLCGISEDEERQRLLAEGQKSGEELAEMDMCPRAGPLGCLCCCCNLVAACFAHVAPPEIFLLVRGAKDARECLRIVEAQSSLLHWGLRLLGWALMFAGLYMTFEPLKVLTSWIPLIGPVLDWGVWLFCLFTTLAFAAVIICLAYLAYHPIAALFWGFLVAAVISLPYVLCYFYPSSCAAPGKT